MPVPVLSVSQMRQWEAAAWAAGRTEAEVIALVGEHVAAHALQMTRANDRVLVLAGKGNNSADARAALPHLHGRRAELLEVKDPVGSIATLERWLGEDTALIIDGLFGIGLDRSLDPEWIAFIERINASNVPVLAVDVPSGLNADSGETYGAAVRAQVTLTVGAPKLGMLQEAAWRFVGRLEVARRVGLGNCPCTSEMQWIMASDFKGYPPVRPVTAHKGTFGHLQVLAGSLGYHGAGVLAARGAQRARPGLITLHALETVYPVIAAQLQAVMVKPLPLENKLPGPWTAHLAGPGLAAAELPDSVKMVVRLLWKDSPLPVVVDATALDWLPFDSLPRNPIRVLTPHPGEAARLLRLTVEQVQANRLGSVRRISKQYGNAWVVLKGHQTVIGRSAGEVYVNGSGNAGMAQGGSGDVLAGYLAGLLAQPDLQADASLAIRYAVWQHGACADRLQRERPNWIVEDLAAAIGSA